MLKRLKLLRDEKGISQKQLADIVAVSQQSINKYENHNIEPDIDTLTKMADYFDTSVDYLIGRTDVRRRIEAVTPCELNACELCLLDGYRHLTHKQRACILQLIDSYGG